MESAITFILVGIAFLTYMSYSRSQRNAGGATRSQTTRTAKKTYTLKDEPAELVPMDAPTDRLFTYQDERKAYKARQALWIRYEDKAGNVTERVVEIYNPENDEVLFTWCRLKQEPRTFARRNILSWQLLPDRFSFDPVVARFWKEEGTLGFGDGMPWRRWLQNQPEDISRRYT